MPCSLTWCQLARTAGPTALSAPWTTSARSAGRLLALGLVAVFSVRTAIPLSIIPGILAAAAIVYAIRAAPRLEVRARQPIRLRIRPVLSGGLGRLMFGVSAFEVGNVAATLLILRATELLTDEHGTDHATQLALGLYIAYNTAATAGSLPAGRLADRLGDRGPVRVLTAGVALFAVSYGLFALGGSSVLALAPAFIAAGVAIGCIETAEHSAVAALAPAQLRGSAFGMLATCSPSATSPPAASPGSCGRPSRPRPPSPTSRCGCCWPWSA